MPSTPQVVSMQSDDDNETEQAPPQTVYQSASSALPRVAIQAGPSSGPRPKGKRKRRGAEESVSSERPSNQLVKKQASDIRLGRPEEPTIELRIQGRKKRRLLIMNEKPPEKTDSPQKVLPVIPECDDTDSNEPHVGIVRHDNPERFHFVRIQDGKENYEHERISWASQNQLDDDVAQARLRPNMPNHKIRKSSDSQHGVDTPKRNKSTGGMLQKTTIAGAGGDTLTNTKRLHSSGPVEPRAQASSERGRDNQEITINPGPITSKLEQNSEPPISLPGGMVDQMQISADKIFSKSNTADFSTTSASAFRLVSLGRQSVRSKEVIWTGTASHEDDLQDGSKAEEEERRHKSPLASAGDHFSQEDEPASEKRSRPRGRIIGGGGSAGEGAVEWETTLGLETPSHNNAHPTVVSQSNNPVKAPRKPDAAQSIPTSRVTSPAPPKSKHTRNLSQRLLSKTDVIPPSNSLHEAQPRKAPLLPAEKPRDEPINRDTSSSPAPPPQKPMPELPTRAVQSTAAQVAVAAAGAAEANPQPTTSLQPKPIAPVPPPTRIPNPATRGCKAAKKSDAAGLEPRSFLPADLVQAAVPPRARPQLVRRLPLAQPPPPPGDGDGVGDVHVTRMGNKNNNIAILPGFQRAGGGPWSAEAGDLLGMGRPGS